MSDRRKQAGFTLVELLTVIAMLVILSGSISSAVFAARKRAMVTRALVEVKEITNAILASENYSEDFTLKEMNGDASRSSLSFILGGDGSMPVLYNGAIARDGMIRDPWGTTYRVRIRRSSDQRVDDAVARGKMSTSVFCPNANAYRPKGDAQ